MFNLRAPDGLVVPAERVFAQHHKVIGVHLEKPVVHLDLRVADVDLAVERDLRPGVRLVFYADAAGIGAGVVPEPTGERAERSGVAVAVALVRAEDRERLVNVPAGRAGVVVVAREILEVVFTW